MKKFIAFILILTFCISLATTVSAKDYEVSSWAEDANKTLKLTWLEDPTENVKKGEFMFALLRMIQTSRDRRGLELLESDTDLEFRDTDTLTKSEQDEASILVDLNVLNGYNGYMNMYNDVTRAEAAKILYFFNAELELDTIRKAPGFDDISGHWAESKINYTYRIGMINGKGLSSKGDMIFDPEGNLTIQELMQIMVNITKVNSDFTAKDVATAFVLTFDVETDFDIIGSLDSDSVIYLTVGDTMQYTTESNSYWTSSNSSVASVTNKGVISARSKGETIIFNGNDVVIKVVVVENTNYVSINDSLRLAYSYSPSWSSSNNKIATVDKYGNVTGVSEGTVKISRTASEYYYVTVVESSIIEMMENETITLSNLKYKWTSSNNDIVTVSASGKVTAIASGTAIISNKYATYFIIIHPISKISMQIGDTLKFDNTWTTSNSNVASVSSTGTITALKKGTATLTSGDNTLIIEVGNYSGIIRNYTLELGDTKILGDGKYDSSWTSENTKIATVSKYGKVTAKAIGEVLVYNNGAEYLITVIKNNEDEDITNDYTIKVGDTKILEDGKYDSSWTSSNPSVATVNKYGKVSAKSAGTTIISTNTSAYLIVVIDNNDDDNSNDDNCESEKTTVYVEGFLSSTYYNALVDETIKIVVESKDGNLENVTLSNSKCKLTKTITPLGNNTYTFTVTSVSAGACILTLEFENGTETEFTINSYKD